MLILAPMFVQAAATLGELANLTPAALGDRLLMERTHRPIASVERVQTLPGGVEMKLTEQAAPVPGGCVRQVWTADFMDVPGMAEANRKLIQVNPATEIVPVGPPCPIAGYIYLDPDVSADRGFATLARLKRFLDDPRPTSATCSDETASSLCISPSLIKRRLRALRPSTVKQDGKATLVWLDGVSSALTEVRFADTGEVSVERRIPAPF